VEVSHREHSCCATVLIQKGVSQVGIDLLGKLVSMCSNLSQMPGSREWNLSDAASSPAEAAIANEQDILEKETTAKMSLLWSVRIPACHSQLVLKEATSDISKELVMFSPRFGSNYEGLKASVVVPAMCVAQVSDNNKFVLHIVNYGYQQIKLKKGHVLGVWMLLL